MGLSFTPAAPPPPLSLEGHRMTTNMVPEGPKCAHRCYSSQRELKNQWYSTTTKYEVRPYPVPRAASETRFPPPPPPPPTSLYTRCIHPFLQVFEFFGKSIQFSKPNAIIRVQSYIVGHNIPGGIRRHARTSPPSRDCTHPNTSKPPSFTMGMYGCIYGWDRNK